MTSSNGNIFRVTGHLCGEFTGDRKSVTDALMFSLICVWINDWVNNREAGDLRRNRAHYDVILMDQTLNIAYPISRSHVIRKHSIDQISRNILSFVAEELRHPWWWQYYHYVISQFGPSQTGLLTLNLCHQLLCKMTKPVTGDSTAPKYINYVETPLRMYVGYRHVMAMFIHLHACSGLWLANYFCLSMQLHGNPHVIHFEMTNL